MSASPQYQRAARFARSHKRLSVAAASAATAGVLSITGVAIASAAQGGSHSTSGQSSEFLFNSITGTKSADGKQSGGVRLDDQRAAGHEGAAAGRSAAQQPILAFSHQIAATPAATKPAAAQPKATKPQPTKPQPAKQAAVKKPAAKPHPAKPKAPAGPTRPYRVYDSVLPTAIPAGEVAAVYATGGYAASAATVAGHRSVVWIDTRGTDPEANALDVEPGDATPYIAGQWVKQRLSKHPNAVAIVYTMRSEWQQVKDNVAQLPGWMQSKVRYWIADPTGYDHIVPGSDATQWYWGSTYDITTASPNFNH
jgi:hypothetical protein